MLSLLLMAAAPAFQISVNPMNDAPTYVAVLAQQGSVRFSVWCGANTHGMLAIVAEPGFSLFESRITYGNSFATQIRFDDEPPIDIRVSNEGDTGFVMGDRQVRPLVQKLQSANRAVLELTNYAGDPVYMTAHLTDESRAAVGEVVKRCGAQTEN